LLGCTSGLTAHKRANINIVTDKYICQALDLIVLAIKLSSVADPGCSTRIPDLDFYPSRIPYPKTATKERDE
jgi:hypothetical protein